MERRKPSYKSVTKVEWLITFIFEAAKYVRVSIYRSYEYLSFADNMYSNNNFILLGIT